MAQHDTHDLVEGNSTRGNADEGIQVSSDDNRINANISTGNGYLDLEGTCDTNVWSGNVWGPFPGTTLGSYDPECVGQDGQGPRPGVFFEQPQAMTLQAGTPDQPGRHPSLPPVESWRSGR